MEGTRTDAGSMGQETEKHCLSKGLSDLKYLVVWILMGGMLWGYLHRAIGKIPLMDFWVNSGTYIEKIMTKQWHMGFFLEFPHALHWNPFQRVCDLFFIGVCGGDNRVYVYAGMMCSMMSLLLLIREYKQKLSSDYQLLDIMGIILVSMTLFNLNQWEILTIWCNFSFMFRIFAYLSLFCFLDSLLHSYKNKKNQVYQVIIYAVLNCIVIMGISQAYFVGLIAAQIGVGMIDCIIYRDKIKAKLYFLIGMSGVIGFVIYYVTLEKSAAMVGINGGMQVVLDYLQGILIMLGSVIVPQSVALGNLKLCLIVGSVILFFSIIALFAFFKMKMYQKTYFPILCMIYGFSSVIVIIAGRRWQFGVEVLTSSRYVVETTIGLLGIVEIYWYCFCRTMKKVKYCLPFIVGLCGIMAALVWTDMVEFQSAPGRKSYNLKMSELAENIDWVSDEELSIFQASAADVRSGIQALKKYHLLLWRDGTGNPEYNVINYISGKYDDGWCEKEMIFSIYPDNISKLEVSYMALQRQELTIIVNDVIEDTIQLNEGEGKFVIPCKSNAYIQVTLKSDYAAKLTAPDVRVASYHLSNIRCVE